MEHREEEGGEIEREQYYIDLLEPEYNILKFAGSSLGHSHSELTKKRMSEARRVNSGRKTVSIEVLDLETGIQTVYSSIGEASRALGVFKQVLFLILFQLRGGAIQTLPRSWV